MNDPPLRPWVSVADDGIITTAHCTCMAGLAECCSHIAALLFTIQAKIKTLENAACTSRKCKWSAISV